jgi:hypothetical protein
LFRPFECCLNLLRNSLVERRAFRRLDQAVLLHVGCETLDWVAPLPFGGELFGNVKRIVVFGMPTHPKGLRFNQTWTFSVSSAISCLFRCPVDRQDIISVDRGRGDSVSYRTIRERLDSDMLEHRRGVGVAVVLDDHDHGKPQSCGKVQALVEVSGIRATISDVGKRHTSFAALSARQRHPGA